MSKNFTSTVATRRLNRDMSALMIGVAAAAVAVAGASPAKAAEVPVQCFVDTTTQTIRCGDLTTIVAGANQATVYGNSARVIGFGGTAIGSNSLAGDGSTAIGGSARAEGGSSVAIGGTATANEDNAIAVGVGAVAAVNGTSVGRNAVSGPGGAAFGASAKANASDSVALGNSAVSSGNESVALGSYATTFGLKAAALGPNSLANGEHALAVGSARATADHAIAIGRDAEASFFRSVALGTAAQTNAANQIALGGQGSHVRIGDIGASNAAQSAATVNMATIDANGVLGRSSVSLATLLAGVGGGGGGGFDPAYLESGLADHETRITTLESFRNTQVGTNANLSAQIIAVSTKADQHTNDINLINSTLFDFDNRITSLENGGAGGGTPFDDSALVAKNTEQDTRLSSVETKNTEQDTRLASVEAKNTEQDTRLSTIETKNTAQDATLTNHATRITSLEGLVGQQANQSAALASMQTDIGNLFELANQNRKAVREANAGVALALAMDTPALMPGETIAVSGGFGYWNNKVAGSASVSYRVGGNAALSAGVGIASTGKVGARVGVRMGW